MAFKLTPCGWGLSTANIFKGESEMLKATEMLKANINSLIDNFVASATVKEKIIKPQVDVEATRLEIIEKYKNLSDYKKWQVCQYLEFLKWHLEKKEDVK